MNKDFFIRSMGKTVKRLLRNCVVECYMLGGLKFKSVQRMWRGVVSNIPVAIDCLPVGFMNRPVIGNIFS